MRSRTAKGTPIAYARGTRAKSVGERIMAGMLSGVGGYGWPGGWSQDRIEQVMHYKHWTYISVNCIARKIAGLTPNLALVHAGGDGASASDGYKSILRRHRYRKSLHTIKPHEEIEPVGFDHPLARLLRRPNPYDTDWDLWYELDLFLELTGNSYLWVVPNRLGLPCELWVIPAHWVYPRVGKGTLVDHYEIRPWPGPAGWRIPADEIIHYRWKSPVHKIDGYGAQEAIAEWIDAGESVDRSRFFQFKNGCFPMGSLELSEQYHDPDDADIDRIYAKFFARLQGEGNYGRPIVTPPGAKYNPLMIAPTEMAYESSADQIRDWRLAAYGVPKEVAGIQDAGTEIAMYGPLAQFCGQTVNPRLMYIGKRTTHGLCQRYDERLRLWWDDATPDNPEQVNNDLRVDIEGKAITPNEIRAVRGREPYQHGGDDPIGQPTDMPLALNTGDGVEFEDWDADGEPVPTDGQDVADGADQAGHSDQPEVEQSEQTADLLATVGGINGAIDILAQISAGAISVETAVQLFVLFFGISEVDARKIIGPTGAQAQQQPAPEANGQPVEPPADETDEGLGDDEIKELGGQFRDELLTEWKAERDADGKRRRNGRHKCGGEGGKPGPCPEGGAETTSPKPASGASKPAAGGSAELHQAATSSARKWTKRIADLPGKVYQAAKAKVTQKYQKLEGRYGRKTAIAIMGAALLGTAVPLPGTLLVAAAPIVGCAELYLHFRGGKALARLQRVLAARGRR